jgi:hypothetical protein
MYPVCKHYVIALYTSIKETARLFTDITAYKPLKINFSQKFEQSNWADSVHADEVSSSDYKKLFSLLEAIYAEAVAREVGKLTKERCCGCEYHHPIQRQHDCIMLSEQERWQSYGLEAIERVITKRMVWSEFVEAIRVMKLQYHKDVREHFDNFEKSPDSTFVYSLMDRRENTKDSEFESIFNYLS